MHNIMDLSRYHRKRSLLCKFSLGKTPKGPSKGLFGDFDIAQKGYWLSSIGLLVELKRAGVMPQKRYR